MKAQLKRAMQVTSFVLLAQTLSGHCQAALRTPTSGWNTGYSCEKNLVVNFGMDAEVSTHFCTVHFPLLKNCLKDQRPIKDCMDVSTFSLAQNHYHEAPTAKKLDRTSLTLGD